MPNLPDAPVILTGTVFSLDLTKDFETKAHSGAKVSIIADGGVAVVKLSTSELAALAPILGDRVCWYVRYIPYAVDTNTGVTTKFVKLVDAGDLDLVGSTLGQRSAA